MSGRRENRSGDYADHATVSAREGFETPIRVGNPPALKPAGERRLLVLKLDHLGDFTIGLPAMRALREAFKDDHITLICGSWAQSLALQADIANDVRTYDFFSATGWNGKPFQDIADFKRATAAGFDIAIDLRVDLDTRYLLELVEAEFRCGIGSRDRFPFLDVILPGEPAFNSALNGAALTLCADQFTTKMRRQASVVHRTSGPIRGGHLIYGPYIRLPAGLYKATFGLRAHGFYIWPGAKMNVEVARDEVNLASARVSAHDLDGSTDGPSLLFESSEQSADESVGKYEFRVHVKGRSWGGSLDFAGVRLELIGAEPPARRLAAELHVGEKLSLLVELVRQRMMFTPPPKSRQNKARPSAAAKQVAALPPGARVMISPLSNNEVRNWPTAYYAQLIGLLLERTDAQIVLLGTGGQKAPLDELAAANRVSHRILNLAGETTWLEMEQLVQMADLVICNNSGVAHLAAGASVPTLAIYSASHQPREWGPRGPLARTLMADVSCSPCGYDRLKDCPRDHLCVRLITPDMVLDHALDMLPAPRARPVRTKMESRL